MLLTDKNKMAATIIANVAKKPETEEEAPMSEDGGESDDSVAMESAAEELMSAIESKSTKGIVEAIKSLVELCNQGEQMEPEESSGPVQY